jgi:membrane dipeptidase
MLAATLSATAAGCGPTITTAQRDDALRLAEETVSVDLHSHPGLVRSSITDLDGHLQQMGRGKLKVALFAAVGDGPLIGRRPQGGLYATREPNPGELRAYTDRVLASVTARARAGKLRLIRQPSDLDALGTQSPPGALLAVEGGDFLEGRIGAVQEAYEAGVRSIQLTHYRVNELGDIQTEASRHGGLTPFGKDVIREMNRLGIVVDVAHLTHDGVRAAVAVAQKPMILSHTVVDVPFARAVSREHARLVAERGGWSEPFR